jgi:hypothetical protein
MRRRDPLPLAAAAPAILRGARDGMPNIVTILAGMGSASRKGADGAVRRAAPFGYSGLRTASARRQARAGSSSE